MKRNLLRYAANLSGARTASIVAAEQVRTLHPHVPHPALCTLNTEIFELATGAKLGDQPARLLATSGPGLFRVSWISIFRQNLGISPLCFSVRRMGGSRTDLVRGGRMA